MTPLRITALLASGLSTQHPLALDSLLASTVAMRDGYPPPSVEVRVPPPESLPLLWHPDGFHHASQAHLVVGSYATVRWTRKSLSLVDAALLTSASAVPLTGRWKAYWMPLRLTLPAGMLLTWWAVGDRLAVAEMLRSVFGLGGKRGSGHGAVARWTVAEAAEDWSLTRPEGDRTVVSRPLPAALAPEGWMCWAPAWLSYPYWRAGDPPLVAVPEAPAEMEPEW